MSFRYATPRASAKRCVSGSEVSTERGAPVPARAAITGSSRRISSAGSTGVAATLLAAAPSSTMSAPSAASRRACAIAAAGSRNRPPSENESSVMLTMPTRSGRSIPTISPNGRHSRESGDLADRPHDLLVIDDAPAVLAGEAGVGRRGQLDRNAYPLRAVALGAADPDAAHQDKAAHDDRVALRAVSLNLRFHANLGR